MAWADRESPKEILCQQNDAKSAPTPSEKFLEVSEPSFKKVLTAPVTGVSVASSLHLKILDNSPKRDYNKNRKGLMI
jgi:hypothetical protein